MNLYIINESSRAALYGIGTYIRELTAALRNSHINLCVVNLKSDKPQIQKDEEERIRYWHFPEPLREQRTIDAKKQDELYYNNVAYLLQLYIEDSENLIFHLNYNHNIILADNLKKAFDCKIIMVVHYFNWSLTVYDNLQRLRTILNEEQSDDFSVNIKKSVEEEKSSYTKADHVICLSNYTHEILCRDYNLDVKKISIIPSGLTNVAESKSDVIFLRKKWNLPLKEKIVLFVGRMDEVKGLSFLIKAFREVLLVYPQSRLVIAGDGDYKTYTKEAQNICTKITYTGFLDKSQLNEWYCMADVGVIPSLFETFGYVAVEMMMCELSIIATATSGVNEIADDNCAFKVPTIVYPDRVEVGTDFLASKILYLLQHPKDAKQMRKNGKERYLKKYSL